MLKRKNLTKIGILALMALVVVIAAGYAQGPEEELLKKGVGFAEKGKYVDAIKEFDKAIEINPNNANAFFIRGFTYFHKGDSNKALIDFNKAIELKPDYADAYNGRGVVYANKGMLERAIADFNKALEINPNNASILANRGLLYNAKGNFEMAISDYNKAIGIAPDYAIAYGNRAVTYFMKKDYDKSWADVRKAESLGLKISEKLLADLKMSSTLNKFGVIYDSSGGIRLNEKGGVMGILISLIVIVIFLLAFSIRIIQQYETGVVFQLGKYSRTLQPGLNFIIPVIEYARVVDMRISTNDIPKQQVMTKDNVPVSINGVVYFKVTDAQTAIIKVQSYIYAISQYAQAALKDVVGGMTLDDLLAERQKIGDEIENVIQKEAAKWGLEVTAIKIQDVEIAEDLKKIMSRQASAEREKRATITKAEGDKLAAVNLAEAAKTMAQSPGAMQLRTLQTIDGLGPSPSNTVVIAVPVDILEAVRKFSNSLTEKKQV